MRELSILEVCLEEKDYVIIHGYLQDIIYSKEKKRYKVDQDIDQHIKLQDVPSGIKYLLVCPWRMTSSGGRYQV